MSLLRTEKSEELARCFTDENLENLENVENLSKVIKA